MSSSIEDNYCNKLETIPQFSGTCWFNSILMVMLYSQGFRTELSKILKKAKKSKEDKLFNFILYMLRHYNDIEKLTKLYEDFNNVLLKPDHLLISYLKLYDKILLTNILNDLNFGHFSYYIIKILTNYNIPYLSIIHHNNNLFAENNKILDFDNTNIVFIQHNITTYMIDYVLNDEYHNIDNIIEKLCSNCNDLKNKKDIIFLNGHIYKLDSCLIRPINGGHVISGITCNNQQYLIDSIEQKNLEKTINSKKYTQLLDPCKPILYNWSISSKICISRDCTIIPGKIDDKLCYDLDKSFVTLIYIKLTNKSPIKFDENSLISKDFKYNKEELSLYVKTLLPNLLNKNNTELYKILSNIYSIESLNYLKENITTKYFLFYEKLVKKPLNILIDKELLLKDIYIQLIYKYYKKNILYKIYIYTDNNIYHIIHMLSFKIEENLNKIKSEYNEIIIKSNINKYTEYILKLYALNIDNIYNILFIKYKAFYDKKILELYYEDKSRQLIVKLLILKEFFKKKYLVIFKEIIDTINKYIANIIYSISFIIAKNDYENNFITIITNEYAEKIYNEYFENNKDFYDNEIINTYIELIGTKINMKTYINIKLLILQEYFNKEYNEIINKYKLIIFKKYYNNEYTKKYNNIIESAIKDYIEKFSLIPEEKLIIKYNKYEPEYYEELILLNIDEIYNLLFNNNKDFFDKEIKNNKNNKNKYDKQIIIKLLVLQEFFNINYNKKIKAIDYKRTTGKDIRSRTSSSKKNYL
jgi:hypothetical protein